LADIVDTKTRSRIMSRIRSRDTGPERLLRSCLHAMGFRYRLCDRRFPGSPDLVFPKYRAVVFIHGCFWHGHDCELFREPKTNSAFWLAKIAANRRRDRRATNSLLDSGWRVATVWECSLRGKPPQEAGRVAARLASWLRSADGARTLEIRG